MTINKKTFPATLKILPHVIEWIQERVKSVKFSHKDIYHLDLAIEEVFVNIVSYANLPDNSAVEVEIILEDKSIVIIFIDGGDAFNPLEKKAPVKQDSLEDSPIGGLGIHLIKQVMDDVSYERKNDKNILTLKKNY